MSVLIPRSLKRASSAIQARERLSDADPDLPLACASALAHARKEYGHACEATSQVVRAYHLRIVADDLSRFDRTRNLSRPQP